jgi:hypothetical protein
VHNNVLYKGAGQCDSIETSGAPMIRIGAYPPYTSAAGLGFHLCQMHDIETTEGEKHNGLLFGHMLPRNSDKSSLIGSTNGYQYSRIYSYLIQRVSQHLEDEDVATLQLRSLLGLVFKAGCCQYVTEC